MSTDTEQSAIKAPDLSDRPLVEVRLQPRAFMTQSLLRNEVIGVNAEAESEEKT